MTSLRQTLQNVSCAGGYRKLS